jgi:small subunit ribosomal protein S4
VKDTGPKVKRSRRLGIALTPKAARVMERRQGPPGRAPQRTGGMRGRRESDYKRQLIEKQRLRAQYNITERQMRNYYEEALKSRGNTGEALVQSLERRLDALVLRAGFAPTIYAARQVVLHGHVQVNGRRVNLPGYQLRPGDVISLKERSRSLPMFAEALESAYPPGYIDLDKEAMRATFLRVPPRSEIPVMCEATAVVEFYSR